MPYHLPSATQQDRFVHDLAQAMTCMAEECCAWLGAAPRSLLELEQEGRRRLQAIGSLFVQGLCRLQTQGYPEPAVSCPCGGQARYQRQRAIQVQTLLGRLTLHRPYYLCPTCHQGQAPLDQAWGVCANSISPALEQALALLGVNLPFADAQAVIETLVGISVSPTTVQEATERVGEAIWEAEVQAEAASWNEAATPPPTPSVPGPEPM
jgi:hypothetical protein